MPDEVDIELKVCLKAQAKGWMALKAKTENRRFFPDRQFMADGGQIFFIEFKKPGGRLHPGQKRTITKLRAMGFHVYVCDTLEYGLEILSAHTDGKPIPPIPARGDWLPSDEE